MDYQTSFFDEPSEQKYFVREIHPKEAYPFLLKIHYAKRIPSISYAYGLFWNGDLVGVVTYGTPPSSTLRSGVCGEEYISNVLELNRLVLLNNRPNEASLLISRSLKLLPRKQVVVSYSDTAQDHFGTIYQATNWLYTGTSKPLYDYALKNSTRHNYSIGDSVAGAPNRAKALKEKYGDDFYLKKRSLKHRYVTFTGTKMDKKIMRRALRYEILPYPKKSLATAED